jgi:hypothetical protein
MHQKVSRHFAVCKALSLKLKINSMHISWTKKSGYTISTEILQFEASTTAQKFSIRVTESRLATGGFNGS